MRKTRSIFSSAVLIAGVFLLTCQSLFATTHTVPGSFSTIQSAINGVANGDTILVAAGTYNVNLQWLNKALTILGAGTDSTFLRPAFTTQPVLTIDGAFNSTLSGFTIKQGGSTQNTVVIRNGSTVAIRRNVFRENIWPNGNSDVSVISIDGASPFIHGNEFYHNGGNASIGLRNGIGTRIWNNTLSNNTRGIYCISPGHGDLRNNSITFSRNASNGSWGVFGIFGSGGYNNVFGNVTNYAGSSIVYSTNISVDPLMSDTAIGDLDFLVGSPNINAGDPAIYDVDSSRSDIGRSMILALDSVVLTGNVRLVPSVYPTIKMAYDSSLSGDTIRVAAGTYQENFTWTKSLSIIGAGLDSTFLEPIQPNLPIFTISGTNQSVLTGFTVQNSGDISPALDISGSTGIEICLNRFRLNALADSSDPEIISIHDGAGPYIHHNVFYRNGGISCIGLRDGVNTRIWNNTMDGNNRGVFCLTSGHGDLRNNSITNNKNAVIGGYGISGQFGAGGYNTVFGNGDSSADNYTNGATPKVGDLSLDPLYVSRILANYLYQVGSPNIDAGDPTMTDPDLSRIDIGFPGNFADTLPSIPNPGLPAEHDTVSTGKIRLAVSSHGASGLNGIGGANLDFVALGADCDTTADVYLTTSGSFLVKRVGPGNFIFTGSAYSDTIGAFTWQPMPSVTRGFSTNATREMYRSGVMVSTDSAVGSERFWYAPKVGDSTNFIVVVTKYWRLTSGATNLQIGDITEWDVPSINPKLNIDGSANSYAWMRGTEGGTANCAPMANRFAADFAIRSYFTSQGICANEQLYGQYTYSSENDLTSNQHGSSTGVIHPDTAWNRNGAFNAIGNFGNDSIDLRTVTTWRHNISISAGDTLVTVMAHAAIQNGTLSDLAQTASTACNWYQNNLAPGCAICGCCVGARGNVDCDPNDSFDIGDLTRLIDHCFISYDALCCPEEADLSPDGSIDIGDVTVCVDLLFISAVPPPLCPGSW